MEKVQLKETRFEEFVWIDIFNPEKEQLPELAEAYGLNLFQLRDSVEMGHLPKIEETQEGIFLILRAFTGSLPDNNVNLNKLTNKVAFFLQERKLITIRRIHFDFMKNVEGKFQNAEDLLLLFIRKILSTFVEPIESLTKRVDYFEKSIFMRSRVNVSMVDIYYHRAQTRLVKKNLTFAQLVVNQLVVSKKAKPALQDAKDRITSFLHQCDEVIDDTNNLVSTTLALNAQKNNDVMKLLTVFSVFFLPLTFIVGVYGMNFTNLPGLHAEFGYIYLSILMVAIVVWIYIWFRKKGIL